MLGKRSGTSSGRDDCKSLCAHCHEKSVRSTIGLDGMPADPRHPVDRNSSGGYSCIAIVRQSLAAANDVCFVRTAMTRKRYKPVVAKLRQVDVLVSQGQNMVDAIRQIGVSEVTYYRWHVW